MTFANRLGLSSADDASVRSRATRQCDFVDCCVDVDYYSLLHAAHELELLPHEKALHN